MTRTLRYVLLLGATEALRQKGPLGINKGGIHHKGPLAISRGGKGSVGIEQLEELVDVVESNTAPLEDPPDDDDEDLRPDDAWRTLVQVWKGRLERGVEDAHPSRARFLSELSARNDNSTARLLQPQRAATLLGTARMAFRRRSLAPHLRRLPRCSACLLYTSPSPRDPKTSRMPSST